MSDPDAAPDPIDQAYAQAEAMLDDETARAARRARVLAAVAAAGQPDPAQQAPSRPRLSWAYGRWLAAASVAGLSVLIGLQVYRPASTPPPSPSAPPPVAADTALPDLGAAAQAPAASTPPAARQRAPTLTSPPETRPAQSVQDSAPAAPPPPRTRPAPSAQATLAAPPAADTAEEVVVTGALRAESAPNAAKAAPRAAQASSPASPAARDIRLRAAAAAGRTAELTALLNQGASVDAADDDGETALMKAIRANHPAAAALLRRNGANLDLKNRSGQSARDIASLIDDPALNRALGLTQRNGGR